MTASQQDRPSLTDDQVSSIEAEPAPQPHLVDLSVASRFRLEEFIITAVLERGVPPTAVMGLYADLAGDDRAVQYADRRFMQRELPGDWSVIEDRVLDLEHAARAHGSDLAESWRGARGVAGPGDEPLESLARLAGVQGDLGAARSIFDDPEDLDALDSGADDESAYPAFGPGRQPALVDLSQDARQRLQKFIIEEIFEHGLPAFELIELYRTFDNVGNERARQYLDLAHLEGIAVPADWLALQAHARKVTSLADRRSQDAGRLYADQFRTSPGMDPFDALRTIEDRLTFG